MIGWNERQIALTHIWYEEGRDKRVKTIMNNNKS